MAFRSPWLHHTLLSAVSLSLAACDGGGTASLRFSAHESAVAQGRPNVYVQAVESPPPGVMPTFRSSDGVTFTLSEARIHLRDIRLDLPRGTRCEDVSGLLTGATCKAKDATSTSKDDDSGESGTVVVPGPLVVDLLTGVTTPDLSGLRLPAGTYKRIDFRLQDARSDDVPSGSPLLGYSLQVKATFERDAALQTLDLKLKFSEDARFESSTGVTVAEDDALLALLSPQTWLEGLPVGQCLQKGDLQLNSNVLRIDDRAKGACNDAESLVRANIKNSGRLGRARK